MAELVIRFSKYWVDFSGRSNYHSRYYAFGRMVDSMALSFRVEGDVFVVEISGEIDHHSAADLKERISREYERASVKDMELELSGVTFMDSSGVGMIIGRFKEAQKRGGSLSATGMSNELERLFELSGLHKIITIR